jgi:hypothetical protein
MYYYAAVQVLILHFFDAFPRYFIGGVDGVVLCSRAQWHVRYWPKADIGQCSAHVRFRGVKQTSPFAEVRFCGRYWG